MIGAVLDSFGTPVGFGSFSVPLFPSRTKCHSCIPFHFPQNKQTKARKHTNNIVRYFVRMPLHHFTTYAAVVQSTSYNFLDTAPASQFLFRPKSKKRASIGTRGCGRQNICPVLRPVVFSSNGFQVMVRERV